VGECQQFLRAALRHQLHSELAGTRRIVCMTCYLIDKREYIARGREVGQAYREVLGRDYGIAMSAVQVSALMEDQVFWASATLG
jgi:hypothetical protein